MAIVNGIPTTFGEFLVLPGVCTSVLVMPADMIEFPCGLTIPGRLARTVAGVNGEAVRFVHMRHHEAKHTGKPWIMKDVAEIHGDTVTLRYDCDCEGRKR